LGVFEEQTWGIVWPLKATMVDQDLIAESKWLALSTSMEEEMAQERKYT
jgi:hypothetical protein